MVNGRVGAKAEHFLNYIYNVMDVLDRTDKKGHYLIMDDALTPQARYVP
jgi:hypothetical protein